MELDVGELSDFIARAKRAIYSREGTEVASDDDGKKIGFWERDWNYLVSCYGRHLNREKGVADFGTGMVRFRRNIVWAMSFHGGILPRYRDNINFSRDQLDMINDGVYDLLGEAQETVSEECFHRNPSRYFMFSKPSFQYCSFSEGSVGRRFKETVLINRWGWLGDAEHLNSGVPSGFDNSAREIFRRNYQGGLV